MGRTTSLLTLLLAALGAAAATITAACGGNAFSSDDAPSADASATDGLAGDTGGGDAGRDADGGPSLDGMPPPADGGATVTGTVVDGLLVPMPGVVVHINGQSATTDSMGAFSIPDVVTPYTIVAVTGGVGTARHAYVLGDFTRLDPTLQLLFDSAALPRSATLTGNATTSTTPGTAGIVFADLGTAAPAAGPNAVSIVAPQASFLGQAQWVGPVSVPANLYNLQWFTQGDGGAPQTYIAYATESATLTNGQTTTWDTPLTPTIAPGTLAATATASSGYVLAEFTMAFRPPGASIAAPLVGLPGQSGSASFVTPDVSGATFVVCALQLLPGGVPMKPAYGLQCNADLPATGSTSLAPPPASTLISPPSTATVGTTFSWNAISGGISVAAFEPGAGASVNDPSLYVMTAAASAHIPDVTGVGLVLRSSATYTASVYGFAPFATLNAAAGKKGFAEMATFEAISQSPLTTGALAYSGPFTFTTK